MNTVLQKVGRLGLKTNEGPWFRQLRPTERIIFRLSGLDNSSRYVLISHDRSTRELAHADTKTDGEVGCCRRQRAPYDANYRPEYWESVLNDPRADDRPRPTEPSIRTLRLAEIHQHILRVSCTRFGRTVEIQKADAVRLAGAQAVWKDIGQRLLDDTCSERTGRHEEDGCWPSFE